MSTCALLRTTQSRLVSPIAGSRHSAAIDPQAVKLKLAPEALAMLTDGIDLRGAKLRPWYERE